MKDKKIPLRTCVVSREKLAKDKLLRIVRTPEKKVIVDLSGKANGRGAYLKKDLAIIEKAKESKILDRILEIKINDSIYEEAKKMIN